RVVSRHVLQRALHPDQLCPVGSPVLIQPIGVDEASGDVVRVSTDCGEEPRFVRHARLPPAAELLRKWTGANLSIAGASCYKPPDYSSTTSFSRDTATTSERTTYTLSRVARPDGTEGRGGPSEALRHALPCRQGVPPSQALARDAACSRTGSANFSGSGFCRFCHPS